MGGTRHAKAQLIINMYTVIRFSGAPEQLGTVGRVVNAAMPGLYEKLDPIGNRFSCSVSSNDDWAVHCAEIRHTVFSLEAAIDL